MSPEELEKMCPSFEAGDVQEFRKLFGYPEAKTCADIVTYYRQRIAEEHKRQHLYLSLLNKHCGSLPVEGTAAAGEEREKMLYLYSLLKPLTPEEEKALNPLTLPQLSAAEQRELADTERHLLNLGLYSTSGKNYPVRRKDVGTPGLSGLVVVVGPLRMRKGDLECPPQRGSK